MAARGTQPQRSSRDDARALRARPGDPGGAHLRGDRAVCARECPEGASRGNRARRDDTLAAGATDLTRVLARRRRGDVPPRDAPLQPRRRRCARLLSARVWRVQRVDVTTGSRRPPPRTRFWRAVAQRARRYRRPRRRARLAARGRARDALGFASQRRIGSVVRAGVRLCAARRRCFDRLELDAAETQSRSVRIGARRRIVGEWIIYGRTRVTRRARALVSPRPTRDKSASHSRDRTRSGGTWGFRGCVTTRSLERRSDGKPRRRRLRRRDRYRRRADRVWRQSPRGARARRERGQRRRKGGARAYAT